MNAVALPPYCSLDGDEPVRSTVDSDWPLEEPAYQPDGSEIDDGTPLEFDDDYWDALAPDDDYEPLPERGDFWTEPED